MAGAFPGYSPFNYVLGNPVSIVDPNGAEAVYVDGVKQDGYEADLWRDKASSEITVSPDDDYVFDENGRFVRKDITDKPDRVVVENSKTGAKTAHDLHDSPTSLKGLNFYQSEFGKYFGAIKFLFSINGGGVEGMMTESEVYRRNYVSRRWKARQSHAGPMDFSVYHLLEGPVRSMGADVYTYENASSDKSAWFLMPDSKVYNHFDAGNWLWGNAMNRLGFSQKEAVGWATGYNRDDSSADLQAIISGYNHK